MAKVAFIGLGVMGYPMAGHLVKAGHEVAVFNRTGAKAAAWAEEFGGTAHPTPAAAAEGADFVMCCVGNDDDLRSVTTGPDGAFGAMKAGAGFVDHRDMRFQHAVTDLIGFHAGIPFQTHLNQSAFQFCHGFPLCARKRLIDWLESETPRRPGFRSAIGW